MAQKILLVEDNSGLADLLSVYLHSLGYETSWARTSAQGISKALAEVPDLIITDLNLPDMTGVDAAAILKQDPLPLIFRLFFLRPRQSENGRIRHLTRV
jgi:CheY-like chemotaxis protein